MPSHTSTTSETQIREAPDVAQAHGVADDGQKVLHFLAPFVASLWDNLHGVLTLTSAVSRYREMSPSDLRYPRCPIYQESPGVRMHVEKKK